MGKESNSNPTGIGVFGLLGVVFVTLKLTGYINWSWWYVTLPFWWWIPVIAIVLIAALIINLYPD